jgi:hypothetical protein
VRRKVRRRFRHSEGGIDIAADVNADISVNVGRQKKEERMGEQQDYQKLSREELNKIAGEELPERAAMSLINANVAAPINAAVALNVASDNSVAYANAEQTGDITQNI